MTDLIDRQEAIDAVKFGITYAKVINKFTGEAKELFKEGNKALNEAAERLKELPSVQPRKGKWHGKGDTEGFGIFICDNCGKFAMMEYDFCPNCGSYNGGDLDEVN